jgi:hypothetical protein
MVRKKLKKFDKKDDQRKEPVPKGPGSSKNVRKPV